MKYEINKNAVVLIAMSLCGPATTALADAVKYPIFDAHVHYSEPAWAVHDASAIIAKFDRSGVARALVSSSPDDGTLRLFARAPSRIVPELRPYRAGVTSGNWVRDSATPGYLSERLAKRDYVGIGEFHLQLAAQVQTPVVRRVIELALEKGILLHVHSDAAPVEALFAAEPRLHILWAHAGFSESPATVGRLMDEHQNLWADLSFREYDLADNEGLDPRWERLFHRHPDRFMVGSDTYVTGRWNDYENIIAVNRDWLGQLPPELARKFAYGSAVRLFGDGGLVRLKD